MYHCDNNNMVGILRCSHYSFIANTLSSSSSDGLQLLEHELYENNLSAKTNGIADDCFQLADYEMQLTGSAREYSKRVSTVFRLVEEKRKIRLSLLHVIFQRLRFPLKCR